MFVISFLKISFYDLEEISNSIFIIHSSTKFIWLFESWHAAEISLSLSLSLLKKIFFTAQR